MLLNILMEIINGIVAVNTGQNWLVTELDSMEILVHGKNGREILQQ